ncbi:MAG: hypothetical protein AABY33_03845 [Pseudomonadota bacterium]
MWNIRKPARPKPCGSGELCVVVVPAVGKGIDSEVTIERQAGELDVEALPAPMRPGYAKLRPFGALLAAGCVGAD